jgi:cysteine synthase
VEEQGMEEAKHASLIGRGIASNVLECIGNTPIVQLRKVVPSGSARILAKLEWANPTGSMKDRVAKAIIESAEKKGQIKPGSTVVEYTAGTTGISLALVCAAKGYNLHIVFSDAFSEEKRLTMQAFGATVEDVKSDNKKITEKLIKEMIEKSRIISERPNHWWSDQLSNRDAITGYYPLGEEIWNQTGGNVDAIVHAVGTAHSILGTARAVRKHKSDVHVAAVEPAESAVLSGGPSGSHKIEGIGIGFVPPLWEPSEVDEIIKVKTEEAKTMTRRLAKEEGLFAGTSSGANVVAALRVAERLGPQATVVTIMVDSGFRYLSTDLYKGAR